MAEPENTPQANPENGPPPASPAGLSPEDSMNPVAPDAPAGEPQEPQPVAGETEPPAGKAPEESVVASAPAPEAAEAPAAAAAPELPTADAGQELPVSSEELDALAAQISANQAGVAAEAGGAQPASNLIDQAELDLLVQQLDESRADKKSPTAVSADPVAANLAAEERFAPAVAAPASGPPKPTVLGSRANSMGAAGVESLEIPSLSAAARPPKTTPIDLLDDVELDVKIELGRTQMYIEDVLHLGEGSVIELDKLAGDPVDIYVNERLVARGEVLVLNENFCVRINDIMNATGKTEDGK